MYDRDDDGNEWLRIPLVGRTRERLDELVRVTGVEPTDLAASLLHDLLEEDAEAHRSPADCAEARRRSLN